MDSKTVPQLVWANKPGCSRAVAELWLGENDLWFTIFVDDKDNSLRVEVLPSPHKDSIFLLDFIEVERLISIAKRELLSMVTRRA